MGQPFASGKNAVAMCDRCGQRFKLTKLRNEVVKQKRYNLLVCPQCFDPDHPQLMLGATPVNDPQALRNPRPDTSYEVSGQANEGSRVTQWGWYPVGGGDSTINPLTPNDLLAQGAVGQVVVNI